MATTTKEPKTIQIKVLVPYAIIVAVAVAGASFIVGWHSQSSYNNQVQADAKAIVKDMQVKPAAEPSK
jgi:hypothetical protein